MITIYGKDGCIFCTKAIKFCQENNLVYSYINLSEKHRRRERMYYRSLGTDILPLIEITTSKKILYGWNDNVKDEIINIEEAINEQT